MLAPRPGFRTARIRWSALVFLLIFTIVAIVVAFSTLQPAAEAAQHATNATKENLSAWFRLLVAVLLFILFVGLMLSLRIGRFITPDPTEPPKPTEYVDAWAESAKRVQVPPADEDLGNEDANE